MIRAIALSLILGFTLVGCVHLNSVSTSSIPADRSRPIEAQAYKSLPFLVSFSNSYLDDLARSLAEQCPDGRVEGILTKQEFLTYFPLVAHAYKVTASGYCVAGAQ